MNPAFKLVVFDWEGTVADTLGQILHRVAEEARQLGFGEVDQNQARNYVSLGLVHSLKKMFPQLTLGQHEQLLQAVQHALIHRQSETSLIPGVKEFISQLIAAGVHVAVATNKGQQSLSRAIQASGLDEVFKVTRSAGQAPPKPCPQMLEEIMDEFGCSVSETLMIGDSTADMEMATSIHVMAIGVDFYHEQEDALKAAGAKVVFNDYLDIANYLHLPKIESGVD